MIVRQLIPEDLAEVAPGLELARVLAGIELSRLSGYDCVEVLKARYRQVNHERAQLMAAMVEVGLCGIGPDDELPRRAIPDEFSADEVRSALVLTRRAANAQFWLAHDLITRLPAVHAALDAGLIDEPRARVLSEWTVGLTAEQARAVCDSLLPRGDRRLGHTYHVRTPPIIEPLPDPIPGYGPAPPLLVRPDDDWDESSIWDEIPPEADIKSSPRPPQPDPHDDPAPF